MQRNPEFIASFGFIWITQSVQVSGSDGIQGHTSLLRPLPLESGGGGAEWKPKNKFKIWGGGAERKPKIYLICGAEGSLTK